MGKAIIVYNKKDDRYRNLRKMITEAFSDRGLQTEEFCFDSAEGTNRAALFLRDADADWICTLDMAGFSLSSLLETFLYNMLTAKQLHIVIEEEKLERYRDEEFALNLFFAVPGDSASLKKKYFNFLNIDGYRPFEADEKHMISDSKPNREIVKQIVDGFFRNLVGN